jgi:hypothetical protein
VEELSYSCDFFLASRVVVTQQSGPCNVRKKMKEMENWENEEKIQTNETRVSSVPSFTAWAK